MAGEYNVEVPDQKLPAVSVKTRKALLDSTEDLADKEVPYQLCIYGDQGTGKTLAMMKLMQRITRPEKKILYIDSGNGWATLKEYPELMKRVKYSKYENIEQVLAWATALNEGGPGFDTIGAVILDEYSSMVRKDRTWVVKARAAQKEKKGEFKDAFQPAQPDYLASQIRSEDILNAFVSTDIHVGFLSHEKFDEKTITTRPDFAPGAAADLQRILHSVLRATVTLDKATKKPVRKLQLQPIGNRVSCKNRVGKLGNFANDISEVAEAYMNWGVIKEGDALQSSTTETTLTKEEVDQIANDDALLLLLNKDNESNDSAN